MKRSIVCLESYTPKCGNRFHCQYCGRFAHFVNSRYKSNANYTDLVLEWQCSKCGYCKEGQW